MKQFSLICTLVIVLLMTAVRQTHGGLDEQSNRQIKLEDIERDNLVSEQITKAKERGGSGVAGGLLAQQTQHLRPPSIYSQNDFQHEQRGHEQEDVGGGGGIVYTNEDYDEQQQQQQLHQQDQQPHLIQGGIQYVTVAPETYSHQQKEYVQPTQAYTPVHEAERTHSAPARYSLISPSAHQPQAPHPQQQQFYAMQPQYVYVQMNELQEALQQQIQQQLQQVGHHHHHQGPIEHEQPQAQQYIQYVPQYISQPQAQQYAQEQSYVMMPFLQQPPTPAAYVAPRVLAAQYAAAIQSQEHQIRLAATAGPDVINFSHAPEIQSQANIQYVPTTQITPSTVAPLRQHIRYQHKQQSSHNVAPLQQFRSKEIEFPQPQPQIQIQPQTQYYTQQYHHLQQQQQQHIPQQQQQLQQQHHHYQQQQLQFYPSPAYDFYSFHKRQPTSLLDSYIPSSVIWARQQQQLQQQQHGGFHQHHHQDLQLEQPNAAYNTIAYSSQPQHHESHQLKRSSTKSKSKSSKIASSTTTKTTTSKPM